MIFAALALWELVIVGVLGVGVLLFLANEARGLATLLFFVALGLFGWFAWEPVKEFFAQPGAALLTVKYVALYLVVGLVFSIFKWVLYSRRKAKEFLADQDQFNTDKTASITRMQLDLKERTTWLHMDQNERNKMNRSWNEYEVRNSIDDLNERIAAKFKDQYVKPGYDGSRKYGIIAVQMTDQGVQQTKIALGDLSSYVAAWASYWPFYAVLLVLDDFLRAVWDTVTQWLRKVFQSITAWAFKV